jgi:RHS repeat-associated protein
LITSVIHPNGGAYRNYYDSQGRIEKQVNPLNGEMLFSYKENETTITMPDGSVKKDIFNFEGQLAELKLAVGTSEEISYQYGYDYTGQVSSETDPLGNITYYTHDLRGNTLSVTDALWRSYTFTYNSLNQLVETTNPLGKKSKNVYDNKGNLVKSISFNGSTSGYEINSNGTNKAIIAPNDLANETNKKILFGYDNNGFINSSMQPEGSSISVLNNKLGSPLAVTNSSGQSTNYTYDSNNQIVKTVMPNGANSSIKYDKAGRVIEAIDALGNATKTTYDLMDNPITIETVLGIAKYKYDNMQRVIETITVSGSKTSYEYDNLGHLIKTIDPKGNISTSTYTKHSLVNSITDALNNKTTYEYDAVGNVISITDALNNKSTAIYDALNRLSKTVSANGYTETYTYDDDNNILSSTKAGVEKTTYEYDANGNLVKTIFPDNSTEEKIYNSDNDVVSVKDRDGQTVSYEYDTAGQVVKNIRADLTEAVYSYDNMGQLDKVSYDNWATVDTQYVYDIAGRVTSEFKNGVETTYEYDAIGNLTKRGPPNENGIQYDYDRYGQLTKMVYPSGTVLNYTYDVNSNLSTIKKSDDLLAKYIYDANGNQTKTEYGNGTTEYNNFDKLNRLEEISIKNSSSELYNKKLELDNAGLIVGAKTKSDDVSIEDKAFSYSATQRLDNVIDNTTTSTQNYKYDVSSNLTNSPLGINSFTSNGKITSSQLGEQNTEYTYDQRGNRTSKVSKSSTDNSITKSVNYSWSSDNKLTNYSSVSATNGTSLTTETLTNSYNYDANGLLVSKNSEIEKDTNGSKQKVSEKDSYVWNMSSVPSLIEDTKHEYVYGVASAPFIQINKTSDEIEYLYGDERGSVIAAADSEGELSWIRTYDEYGSTFNQSSTNGIKTAFAYAGEYLDEDTGLYNLRARWYEPSTASFISVDPILSQSGEGYSYASANPLSFTDPLGLISWGNVSNSVFGALDGITGIPVASSVMNAIWPGSVELCSTEYTVSNIIGSVGSTLIPGLAPIKAVGTLAAIGYGAFKTYKAIKNSNKGVKLAIGYGNRITKPVKDPVGTKKILDDYQKAGKLKSGTYTDMNSVAANRIGEAEINHVIAKDALIQRGMSTKDSDALTIVMAKQDHRALSTTSSTKLHKNEANLPIEEVITRDVVEMKYATIGGKGNFYDDALNSLIAQHKSRGVNINIEVRKDGVYQL